jgi:hypothetical protein
MRDCIAVYSCSSNAITPIDAALEVTIPEPISGQTLTVECSTHFDDNPELHAQLPRDLGIEVRGQCDSLNEFVGYSLNAAGGLLPFLAVSCNAAFGDCVLQECFDATPTRSTREIAQHFPFPKQKMRLGTRAILLEATWKLIQAVDTNPFREELYRALSYYQLALSIHPDDPNRLMAYLWMGIEALTPVALTDYLSTTGLSRRDAANALGVAPRDINAGIRCEVLFQADKNLYTTAKRARNGFTHSLYRFDQVRALSAQAWRPTISLLRGAILKYSGLDDSTQQELLDKAYDFPLFDWDPMFVARGVIHGSSPALAADGRLYPDLGLKIQINKYQVHDDGRRGIDGPREYHASLADGLTFQEAEFVVTDPLSWAQTQP